MAAVLVIALSGSTSSGATVPTDAGPQAHQARESAASPRVAPVHCSARKAVKFYAGRIAYWRRLMSGAPQLARWNPGGNRLRCPRYLAHVLQRKAYAAHKAFTRWHEYHYHWAAWLPAKWQRIGRCETGHTWRTFFPAGNFHWESSPRPYRGWRYLTAFGIRQDYAGGVPTSGYSQFAHEIGQLSWDETRSRLGRYPTPREQFNVALRIYYHYGFSGWGCRNA